MARSMKVEARLGDTNSRRESLSYPCGRCGCTSMSYFRRGETQREDSSFVATQSAENHQGNK